MKANVNPKMEIKKLTLRECKYDTEKGTFEGYASRYGNVDSDNDVVEKGAFANFLADDWSRVKILALHNDEWLPIGKPIDLVEDDTGLYIKVKISETSMGKDVLVLLRDGVLDELSIGYIVIDHYIDEHRVRHLTELVLLEVSVVTWAANELAKILEVKKKHAVKSAETTPDILDEVKKIKEMFDSLCSKLEAPSEADDTAKTTKKKSSKAKHNLKSTIRRTQKSRF